MNTPTPETDEAWKAVSRTPDGMYDSRVPFSAFASAMSDHSKKMERERNAALEDLAFRRDLYKLLSERHDRQYAELAVAKTQRDAALDALRSIENIAANHPDTPLLALDSIIITARKILASPDESTTN